jgi:hypothetical protein
MKKYYVEVPVAGYMGIEVEAESEEEAIENALSLDWNDEDIMELDKYEKLMEGNVCHVWHSRATASLIDEE